MEDEIEVKIDENTCKWVFENMIRLLDVCQEIGGGGRRGTFPT